MQRLKKLPFLIYLLVTLSVLGLFALGVSLARQVEDTSQLWQRYHGRAVQMDETLHQIVRNFGYGGFIHDFKNYVLRQDESLPPKLAGHLAATRLAMARFRQLSDDPMALDALATLEAVVDEYAGKLDLARQLVAQGMSPRQIDRRVKVDDDPALQAIARLQERIEAQAGVAQREVDAALHDVVVKTRYSALLFIPFLLLAMLLVWDRRELSRARERSELSQRYLSELLEAMPDALLIVDESGRIVRVNLQAEHLLGYRRAQLVGMTAEDLLPEDLRAGHVGMREQHFASGQGRPMTSMRGFRVRCADGSEVPVSISLSYSLQDSGRVALVSLRDISQQRQMETALQREHEALQMAQSLTHLGSWDWDLSSGRQTWSDEMFRLLDLEPRSVQPGPRLFLRHVHPADRRRFIQALRQVIRDGGRGELEYRIVRADGGDLYVHGFARLVNDDGGNGRHLLGTVQDITERKQRERELQLDQAIIDQVSQPILITDQDSNIVDANDAFCEMTGYQWGELRGKTPALLKSGLHDQEYYRRMWDNLMSEGRWQSEVWLRTKSGEILPRLMSVTRVCDDDQDTCRYVGIYADITALKENQARLENLAHFDVLTGVANRILFQDRLRAGMARARRSGKLLALLYLDLDGFKAVNDRFGHQRGDELLVDIAARLSQSVREDDTVARLGGDEFAIILNEVDDRAEVEELAGRLLRQVTVTVTEDGQQEQVSGSLGIAIYPQDADDPEGLLAVADRAMYQAKQSGRNRYVIHGAA